MTLSFGRESQAHGRRSHLWDQGVEHLQSHQYHHRGDRGRSIHSRTASQSDSRRYPQSCRCRKSAYHIFLKDDGSRAEESDSRDNLRGHPRRIFQIYAKSVLRNDAEEGTAQRDEKMRAEPRILGTEFPFYSDDSAQQQGDEKSKRYFQSHIHLLSYF